MSNDKIDFCEYNLDDLKKIFIKHNIKPYLASQLFNWIYKKNIIDYSKMSDISKQNIDFLNSNLILNIPKIVKKMEDPDGTVKFLLELEDKNQIETVVMKFDYGNSLCITSQVGCNMGCKFCASGQLKKIRNLSTSEMIQQVLIANNFLTEKKDNVIRNIVIMGIGEPLDNYDNLKQFLKIVNNDLGLCIGSRKITVSTCGLANKILDFARDFNQIGLAISLHAPNNNIRNQIMPINQAFKIEDLMEKVDQYIAQTNRRVTFEYILLKNINDQKHHAMELVDLLRDKLCYVNLIPYNNIDNLLYERSANVMVFYDILKKHNINVTIRQEKGLKINSACGQLRAINQK